MKTIIVEDSKQQAASDSFPRLWRAKHSGSVYLETEEGSCRIFTRGIDEIEVIPGDHSFQEEVYERITSPITIRFEP